MSVFDLGISYRNVRSGNLFSKLRKNPDFVNSKGYNYIFFWIYSCADLLCYVYEISLNQFLIFRNEANAPQQKLIICYLT